MSNVKYQISHRRGFTLIETMIVILIIGIMAGVSWATFKLLQPSWGLNSAVRELVGDLRWAQQIAVTEQTDYGIHFSSTTREYQLVKYSTSSQILTTKALPTGIDFREISFSNQEVIFNPYGAAQESGDVSLINSKEETKTIEVRPSGFVKIK